MSERPIRILLQTTIPPAADDWSIARFGLLAALLRDQRDDGGAARFAVTTRDRGPSGADDPVMSGLDTGDFDQMWLFAVDTGDGLTTADCAGISRFRKTGGGLLVTRDHMDLGSSICTLDGVGAAHHFHTRNLDPDEAARVIDDTVTSYISWPNYHSGANGDAQEIEVADPRHPVLEGVDWLPAHPHEGAVSAPPDDASARVIARSRSRRSGRPFNLAVAFEAQGGHGRAIAESTFHHFVDYNWDTAAGCPSFVDEPPGDGMARAPEQLASTHRYAVNIAGWLGRRGS